VRVTDIRTFVVERRSTTYVFVKVETDAGIHGWGEATLEGKELSVAGAIQEVARQIIDHDPLAIEAFWRRWHMTSCWKGVPDFTAVSGIEQALWDIAGKAYDQPVHRLLGGPVRDRVRAYTWPGPYTTPEECGQAAAEAVERHGFTALKFDPFGDQFFTIAPEALDHAVRCMRAAREAVGPAVGIAVDGHWRFGPQAAIQIIRALEPIGLFFFEEPVPSDNDEMLARVRAAVSVPLATGERHYTRWGIWNLLKERLVDIIQADICHCGGILELRKMAAMAEPCGVTMAPHNPNGPVSLAAVVQFAACTPNFLITESVHTETVGQEICRAPLLVEADGHIPLPTAPGLGIELDEAALTSRPGQPRDLWFPPRVVY
jgi:galactonate dehydratase